MLEMKKANNDLTLETGQRLARVCRRLRGLPWALTLLLTMPVFAKEEGYARTAQARPKDSRGVPVQNQPRSTNAPERVYRPAPQAVTMPSQPPNQQNTPNVGAREAAAAAAQAERQRARQELHNQLRAEQNRLRAASQGDTSGQPNVPVAGVQPGQKLTPEERRALREQVREKRSLAPPQYSP
jgi:hypothetical protein